MEHLPTPAMMGPPAAGQEGSSGSGRDRDRFVAHALGPCSLVLAPPALGDHASASAARQERRGV